MEMIRMKAAEGGKCKTKGEKRERRTINQPSIMLGLWSKFNWRKMNENVRDVIDYSLNVIRLKLVRK